MAYGVWRGNDGARGDVCRRIGAKCRCRKDAVERIDRPRPGARHSQVQLPGPFGEFRHRARAGILRPRSGAPHGVEPRLLRFQSELKKIGRNWSAIASKCQFSVQPEGGHMSRGRISLLIVSLLILFAATAYAGGWAVVTVNDLPD